MKVLTAFLRYDYGIKERGVSLEKECFLPAIEKVADVVVPFWLEDNGFPGDLPALQTRLLAAAGREGPDLIFFILMNSEITVETLTELSKKCVTVNWFCDDQWRFEDFTRRVAPALTFSVTTDRYSLAKYAKAGCRNVIHSQWAAAECRPESEMDNGSYDNEICFIGGANPTRRWMVEEIEKRGFKVACFGSGWDRGRISYDQIRETMFRSKINLNLSNSISHDQRFLQYLKREEQKKGMLVRMKGFLKGLYEGKPLSRAFRGADETADRAKNVEQIKARNFEIPACGGFQLTQYCLEIEEYFDIGKEVAVFSNVDDLFRQLEYYLSFEEERERIRRAGHARSREHTYENRMMRIFTEVGRSPYFLQREPGMETRG